MDRGRVQEVKGGTGWGRGGLTIAGGGGGIGGCGCLLLGNLGGEACLIGPVCVLRRVKDALAPGLITGTPGHNLGL